jgi:hypothetical protein
VENARSIAKRRPPSYMCLEEESEPQQAPEDPPSLDEMQKYDSDELRLPEVPPLARPSATPPTAYNWTASPELPMRS